MKITDNNRAILRIALPAIVTNITTPILGLVDTAIVGHLGSAAYIGAIAVGASMFNMVYWLLGFLRAGTSGLTAQAVGREDRENRDLILWRSLLIGGSLGLLALILSPLIATYILPFMEADASTSALAEEYFYIVIWGAPAYLVTNAASGWLLGNQNSMATLYIAVVTNVVNILLSLIFVLGCGMKIEGVGLGTALAQWVGAFTASGIIFIKYRPEKANRSKLLEGEKIRQFFKLNANIFLRTVCLVAVTLWFTREGASMGADTLAANAILMQFFMLFSFFMDGFAYAGEALGGKFYGASDTPQVIRLEKTLLKWGIYMALTGVVIYFFGGEWFISLLTNETNVREMARDYSFWAVTIPLFGFMAFIYDGIYIGLTMTRELLLTMLMAMAVFFILYFCLRPEMGNHALWLAFSAYLLIRGVSQSYFLRRFFNNITSKKKC